MIHNIGQIEIVNEFHQFAKRKVEEFHGFVEHNFNCRGFFFFTDNTRIRSIPIIMNNKSGKTPHEEEIGALIWGPTFREDDSLRCWEHNVQNTDKKKNAQ